MSVDTSFWDAGKAMLKLFKQRRATLTRPEEQPCRAHCDQDAKNKVHRLALEELGKAGLLGHRLDRLQQAEVCLKISRRLLTADTEGERVRNRCTKPA